MQELTVLVLRGCEFLENIDQIQWLKSLVILEISGATSLMTIPDDLLQQLLHLQSLNFSEVQVEMLPSSISNLTELRWLILRGCRHLKMLPRLSALQKLEVIDLFGASCFQRFYESSFLQFTKLRILDVSHSQIDRLPLLYGCEELTQLVLRNCRFLTRLPRLKTLSNLQVLDLSGAICLKEIYDDIFKTAQNLKVLDFSEIGLHALPSITCNLSHILLRNCTALTKLPSTKTCKDLELLDLSGSSNLVKIEDQSFKHLWCLRCLNLSNTKLRSLPSLAHLLNLRFVILRDCEFLKRLPEMKGLAGLEVLDLTNARSLTGFDYSQFPNMRQLILCGCSSLSRLPAVPKNLEVIDLSGCTNLSLDSEDSHPLLGLSRLRILRLSGIWTFYFPILESLSNLEELNTSNLRYLPRNDSFPRHLLSAMRNLRILNLSKTPIYVDVFFLSNLTQLSLRGWTGMEDASGLEKLTRLEVLDLSETAVTCLPSLKFLCNLRQLLLRDCWGLKKLQHLESLSHLEVLDLWGTGIKEFPYEISELPRLKNLHLPLLKDTEELDWRRIKCLPEELNWVDCGIFGTGKRFPSSVNNLHIMVSGSKFFEFFDEMNPVLWDTYFKQFYFSVLPPRKQGDDGDFFSHRDEAKFRDIYSRTRCFPRYLEIHRQSLEIRSCSPFLGLQGVLKRARYICLRDNANISCLYELGANNIRAMRGCWIERCTNMESVFSREEEAVGASDKLETLQILNLPNLKSICDKTLQVERFSSLKHLYLDCCPLLEIVFSSSHQPMNLETLQIRFCDNLKCVFESDGTTVCSMKHLRTLHLFELPELKSIGAALPSLERFTGGECPKLDEFFTCFFLFVGAIQNWTMTTSSGVEEQCDDSNACLGLPKFPPRRKHMGSQK
ncbi:putative disease resistance protein At4g19050 [Carica papaya]|uniref:putative disease resistance protein At4g19050 n=1 Tax=Carica papaya TaxID=3649 RepID=UPI000B8C800A|nr:putative disease resistance protein At4g19050 [Carica papaya]